MLNLFKRKPLQTLIPETIIPQERELSLEQWMKEFKVGSKYKTDTITEIEIKKLIIKSSHNYSRIYQNNCLC